MKQCRSFPNIFHHISNIISHIIRSFIKSIIFIYIFAILRMFMYYIRIWLWLYIFPDIIIWINVLLNILCTATIAINIECPKKVYLLYIIWLYNCYTNRRNTITIEMRFFRFLRRQRCSFKNQFWTYFLYFINFFCCFFRCSKSSRSLLIHFSSGCLYKK